MEFAKSITLGGDIVYAKDASYKSYTELKLVCVYCGEPVFLKSGYYRVNHFSHFPSINKRVLEECILKQKKHPYCKEHEDLLKQNYLSKEQRLSIFQNSYLAIIANGLEKKTTHKKSLEVMKKKIDAVKKTNLYFFLEYHETNIIELFVKNKYLYKLKNQVISLSTEENELNREIIRESINYLCAKSSRKMLSGLIHYIFFELCTNPEFNKHYTSPTQKYLLANLQGKNIASMIREFQTIIVEVLSSINYIESINDVAEIDQDSLS